MKKLFLSILLLCCCIVFTGCGGNSNSYDGAYRITVSESIINDGLAAAIRTSSSDSVARDITLKFNDIEFPGHSFDSKGNYIFTKVMFEQDAYEMTSRNPSVIKLYNGSDTEPLATIEFEGLVSLPQNIDISMNKNGDIEMVGSNGVINVYRYKTKYKNEKQPGYYKVKDISLKKENSLTAKVTVYNPLGNTIPISFDTWKITAINSNGKSITWTSEQNSSDIIINEYDNDDEAYYTITLSSSGERMVGSHSLVDTSIRIDEIKLAGKDVLSAEILSKAYLP